MFNCRKVVLLISVLEKGNLETALLFVEESREHRSADHGIVIFLSIVFPQLILCLSRTFFFRKIYFLKAVGIFIK